MDVQIPCELYARFADIPLSIFDDEKRRYFQSLFIERKENQLSVFVTNGRVAAVENLGVNVGPDEYTAIIANRDLAKQCDLETPHGSNLHIVANSMLEFTTIKTTFGYTFHGNANVVLPTPNEFITWRKIVPDELPTASNGAMYWAGPDISALAASSKTGGLRFPLFIDIKWAVVINDDSDAWCGFFKPNPYKNEHVQPAIIPDWI